MENNPNHQGNSQIPDLTVMLPAYGEADNLRELLPKIKSVVQELGIDTQILVIDAAEPIDNTEEVCSENQILCLPRQDGNRYGDAVRTGIKASEGMFVVTMDSDGSHNPNFIKQLWKNRDKADLVIASRYIPGGFTENPWFLVAMSRLLNIVFKTFVGIPVYDISNSFRLYRGDLLRNIEPTYANFDILEEILAKIVWGDFVPPATILEIPFRFEKRKSGKPKRKLIVFTVNFVVALLKLRSLRIRNQ